MKTHTDYLWFQTKQRREMIRITDEVAAIVRASGVQEGLVLVSAMHITAGVYVNDWEEGLIEDIGEWLEHLAPARPEYRHHRTGEDNADAHRRGEQAGLPVFVPRLDLTTDNAAMIGDAALRRLEAGRCDDLSMGAEASLGIGD